MFKSRNKLNNNLPCKPEYFYIKVGFKGGQHYIGMFCDVIELCCIIHSVSEKKRHSRRLVRTCVARKIHNGLFLRYPCYNLKIIRSHGVAIFSVFTIQWEQSVLDCPTV